MSAEPLHVVIARPRPDGNRAFTEAVLEVMADMVTRDLGDADIGRVADRLRVYTPNGTMDKAATLLNDFAFLQDRISYVSDPPGVETILSPRRTILDGMGGDCDDMAVAAAAICTIQGFDVGLQAIAWRNNDFTHVYTVADGVPFDLTLDNLGDARPARKALNKMIIGIADRKQVVNDYATFSGLDDASNEDLAALLTDANSSLEERKAAYLKLRQRHPAEMRAYFGLLMQSRQLEKNRIADLGDLFTDVLSTAIGFVVGGPGGAVAAGTFAASGGGDIITAGIKVLGDLFSEKHVAQTHNWTQGELDALPYYYWPEGGAGSGDETTGQLGAIIDSAQTGDFLGSYDGKIFFPLHWYKVDSDAVGQHGLWNDLVKAVKNKGDSWTSLPGKWRVSQYPDYAAKGDTSRRYDLISPGGASETATVSKPVPPKGTSATGPSNQGSLPQQGPPANASGMLPGGNTGTNQTGTQTAPQGLSATGAAILAKLQGGQSLSGSDLLWLESNQGEAKTIAGYVQNGVPGGPSGGGTAPAAGGDFMQYLPWIGGGLVLLLLLSRDRK